MSPKSVYITRLIPESGVALLTGAGFAVKMNPLARQLRRAELLEEAGRHAAIICQVPDAIDREVLQAAAPSCKIIALCAVGVDNVDLTAAQELGVVVTNTPDVLTEATADLTWALLMATARRLGEAERFVRAGAWRGWGMLDFMGADVHGRTLGIVGAGRIGTAVAKRARGFDMPVLYCARHAKGPLEALGAARAPVGELLRKSDFISLHVPLTPQTHHLIDDRALGDMKPTSILINTSRGAVVDQVALIDALRRGRIAAAGLDVYDKEPAIPQALLELDNVVLLPHIGSATATTRAKMAEIAAANAVAVLRGQKPLNPVLP